MMRVIDVIMTYWRRGLSGDDLSACVIILMFCGMYLYIVYGYTFRWPVVNSNYLYLS